MNKKQEIFIFVLIFGFIMHFGYSETLFRVSGKVLRKGKGVKDIIVTCSRVFVKGENSDLSGMKDTITNDKGEYFFELKQGEYWLGVNTIETEDGFEELKDPDLPLIIKVKDKNIKNLNFHLYTEKEIIEANKDVFELVDKSKPYVKYEYGIIPLHSKEECDRYAKEKFICYIEESKKDKTLVNLGGASFKKSNVFYDLQGNPILYRYSIQKNEIEVGIIYVFAVGDKVFEPAESPYIMLKRGFVFFSKKRDRKRWLDDKIKEGIENYSERNKLKVKDIKLVRLIAKPICFSYSSNFDNYMLIKDVKNNKLNLIDLRYYESFPLDWSFEKIRKWYERKMVFEYIKEVRAKQGKPLMRGKK